MSALGRYRKLYARLWRHPAFLKLTDTQKILMLYVLTGPQTNRLGLYRLYTPQAIDDLKCCRSVRMSVVRTLEKNLACVCRVFGWSFDAPARVLYIPSWFTWNPPANVNALKGSLKDLNELPASRLLDLFAANTQTLSEAMRPIFLEGLRERFPGRFPEGFTTSVAPQGSGNRDQRTEIREQRTEVRAAARTRRRGAVTAERGLNGAGLLERFNAFWTVYPRKVAKDAAWKAWQRRRPSAELTQQICAALAWQRQQDGWLKDGGQFIPNPATWINAGRWQDEPTTTPRLSEKTIAIGRATEEFLK